jgi:hypothetical protein
MHAPPTFEQEAHGCSGTYPAGERESSLTQRISVC